MEIERKWLVDPSRIEELKNLSFYFECIDQYYLNDPKDTWVIRLRKSDDTIFHDFFLTLKSKGLLSREEIETKIIRSIFDDAVKHARTFLSKTRYHLEIDPDKLGVFEIDVYKDYDFITCEVEFETEEDAKTFVAPDWCIEDVTEDPKYKNINLAKPI